MDKRREVVDGARRIRSEKLRENQGKSVEWYGENNV